jgi:hypothetical protein
MVVPPRHTIFGVTQVLKKAHLRRRSTSGIDRPTILRHIVHQRLQDSQGSSRWMPVKSIGPKGTGSLRRFLFYLLGGGVFYDIVDEGVEMAPS